MTKKIYLILWLVIFISFFSVSAFSQKSHENGKADLPDNITLDVIAEIKPEGVVFEHKKHIDEFKLSCRDCHHMFDKKNEEAPKPCIECHDLNEHKVIEGIRTSLIKTSVLKNIYHDMCKSCHDKLIRAGKPFPKKCSTCHPYDVEEK